MCWRACPCRYCTGLARYSAGCAYLFSSGYAARLRENLHKAGLTRSEAESRQLLHANIREMGKGVMELPWVWRRPLEKVLAGVKQCHGWEHIEAARAQGKGVIALTPHLGCFEIISLFIASRLPITSMYRPSALEISGHG